MVIQPGVLSYQVFKSKLGSQEEQASTWLDGNPPVPPPLITGLVGLG